MHARYLTNTHEQLTIYVVSTLALSTLVEGAWLRLLSVASALFVVARVIFWIGYARAPVWRALGIAMNMVVSTGVLLVAIVRIAALCMLR